MPTESEALRAAFFGLLPDNWRMWAIGIGVALFVFLNPQAAWSVGSKIVEFVTFVIGKIRGIAVPGESLFSNSTSAGIELPLQAAQAQIDWAVRNNNAVVFESATATLKALMGAAAKTIAVLFFTCICGCGAVASSPLPESQCEYSKHYQFGYTPLTQTDREMIYQHEPTLKQQAPELFDDDAR